MKNKESVEYRLIEVSLEYDRKSGLSKAILELNSDENEEEFPDKLKLNCQTSIAKKNQINSFHKVRFQKTKYGFVFNDPFIIKKFGVKQISYWQHMQTPEDKGANQK